MKTRKLFLFVVIILITSLLTACVNNPKWGVESDDINNFGKGKQMWKNMRNWERWWNFGSGMRGALSWEMMINTDNMRKIPSFQWEETE